MQTNPFLKELMESFINVGGRKKGEKGDGLDFDELGVSDVIDVLDSANMEAVVRDFGRRNQQEDPVIHFFEGFLQEYDRSIRKERGVFYTPRPVVSFIVRSADEKLRTDFGLEDGLADTSTWGEVVARIDDLEIPEGATPDQAFVQILDPATGTGTFLVEVIDLIHRTMIAKWQAEGHGKMKIDKLWNDYVPEQLLPRLHGYELMMAPYAIAHMKIGLKLYETGYRFESDERARVYLTNALEPAQDFSGRLVFAIPALAREAEAVNAIKRDQRFTVVLGNPPYARHSSNPSKTETGEFTFIGSLIEDYKEGCPELRKPAQSKYLQDDYIKFLRLCEFICQEAGAGVLGIITNHGFLDNPTFRGVRRNLIRSYPKISVLDLHGNTNKGEVCPDGSPDKNVFAIRQGVAITVGVRLTDRANPIALQGDIWGTREEKYEALSISHSIELLARQVLEPKAPSYLLVHMDTSLEGEFLSFRSFREIFSPMGDPAPGLLTTHDSFAVAFSRSEIEENVEKLIASSDEAEARSQFKLCSQNQWNYGRAKAALTNGQWKEKLIPLYYRPFDTRFTVYDPHVAVHRRERVTRHMMAGDNLAIITSRMTKGEEFRHAQVTRFVPEVICMSPKTSNNGFVFPLWLEGEDSLIKGERVLNIDKGFLKDLGSAIINIPAVEDDPPSSVTPDNVFGYLYAVIHSPNYRSRYVDFLKSDFPRIPMPINPYIFHGLANLGRELIGRHLMEFKSPDKQICSPSFSEGVQIEKISFSDETVWVDKAKTLGFTEVPEEVWNFRVGGYQVCEKWLKDRGPKRGKPGRFLTDEDIKHYQKIVVALSETIRIMAEIDEVIEVHGGWPGAFQTADAGGKLASDGVYPETDEGDTQLDMVAEPRDG